MRKFREIRATSGSDYFFSLIACRKMKDRLRAHQKFYS